MKKRTVVAIGLLILLIGAVGVIWLSREPTYEGKTLRQWLEATDARSTSPGLETIAARAVPYYARALKTRDSSWRRFRRGVWLRLPDSLQGLVAEPLPADAARIGAAVLLKSSGALASPALPALLGCLKDPNEAIRQCALEAVAEIEPGAPNALPLFIEASTDSYFGVRRCAMEALVHYGPAGRPAILVLTERLTDTNAQVRACAAGALWEIAHQTNSATDVLAKTLHDENPVARALSARYLGYLGPAARPLIPALLQALKDNKDVAEEARQALEKIDPQPLDQTQAK